MAIIGKIEDILKQNSFSERIEKGLNFLSKTNLQEIFLGIENGSSNVIEIDGRNLFVVFSSYQIKVNTPPIFEGHQKYIDIQFIIKGEEAIFVTSGDVFDLNEYSSENDCQLCKSNSYSSFILKPGIASILYPEDWHAPGQQSNQPKNIKKIVVKVAIEEID
jgi:biofilm protein TabA